MTDVRSDALIGTIVSCLADEQIHHGGCQPQKHLYFVIWFTETNLTLISFSPSRTVSKVNTAGWMVKYVA